jgi:hypothetical protein
VVLFTSSVQYVNTEHRESVGGYWHSLCLVRLVLGLVSGRIRTFKFRYESGILGSDPDPRLQIDNNVWIRNSGRDRGVGGLHVEYCVLLVQAHHRVYSVGSYKKATLANDNAYFLILITGS